MCQIKFYLHGNKVHLMHELKISLVYLYAVNFVVIFIT